MVTGSAGGVGKAITDELIQNGHEVSGFDRAINTQENGAEGSDILDYKAVLKAASGQDVIIHLAAEPERFEIFFASSKAKKLRLDPEPAKRILGFEAEDIWPEGQPFI